MSFQVAPLRERGLKFLSSIKKFNVLKVAPLRERGLKLGTLTSLCCNCTSRSLAGAWIEMAKSQADLIPL